MTETADLPAGLPAEALRTECDPASLGFATTAELGTLDGFVGQDRATEALQLSVRMAHRDFNAFVLGREGFGRHETVRRILNGESAARPVPADWVYVNNFDAPHRPRALKMPPGTARVLKRAMEGMVDDLGSEIPALFESDEYQTQRRALEQEFGGRHEEELGAFAEKARKEDVALIRTPMGFVLAAIIDGEIVKPDVFQTLDAETREQIEEKIGRLQDELATVLRNAPKLEKEHRRRLERLHAEMAERTVSDRLREVSEALPDLPELAAYLEAVRKDIIDNAELFLAAAARGDGDGPFPQVIRKYHLMPEFERYHVNVMISHDGDGNGGGTGGGAPVVEEDLPSMGNLIGRTEYVSRMGALVTNFTLIKPGALHRANGGYLVLDAQRLLSEPLAWDALKRCLRGGEIRIASMADRLSLVTTVSLEPDPIPLDLRVVLIGDRWLHAMLSALDPEFSELFKIEADFEDDMPRSAGAMTELARLITASARAKELRPLEAAAVARLLDEATRLAQDAKKISLEVGALDDLMTEADHYAGAAGRDAVTLEDMETAIARQETRAARIRDRIAEAILRETILIETDGAEVGQINGLSVYDLGRVRFGRPSRITARVRMGSGKLIDIEREVKLGGPLHSKGVLILSGYLAATYAPDLPMSLHASVVFEQSYGGIDGDSASAAELFAILSALARVPIRQGLAVTGSVNQRGEVQAIGGVNEKIEGFFDICAARGLTGGQGVLIPRANVDHLMLKPAVVAAVREGRFRVIPIASIGEGLQILTGRPAGTRDEGGAFPEGSVNAGVEARLRGFAEARRAFGGRGAEEEERK